jgi:predicted PurR-regulated permease PerM
LPVEALTDVWSGDRFVAKASATPRWQRALIVLTGTIVGVVVISCLYWAQTVLVPVALAVFLTFLLTPLVSILQRRGLRRTPSVVLVVLLAGLVLGGVGWLVTAEATSLADKLPTYADNIKAKVRALPQMGTVTVQLEKMIQDLTGEWKSQPANPEEGEGGRSPIEKSKAKPASLEGGVADKPPAPVGAAPEKPSAVVPQPESPAWLAGLPALLRPVVELLGGLALALVLVVFMLLNRENLRSRLIRLVGHGRMTATTKALDDAGQRISRFLLMQLIINASFGVVLAIGLLVIQVPHALLWGFLAAVLRYVPYLGSLITATLLVTLSLAMFPGWWQPILVVVLIAVLELATANIVEPRFFGRSLGVSEVALLVAAAFWAFLWGPIGLVLSSPLTVCLVVLGKYVPQLEFLDVILGDEPSSDPDVTYYQRLLARDQDEATQLVLAQAKASSPEQVFDGLLVPALHYAKRDRERDDLTEADEQFVLGATREIVEDLGERQATAAGQAGGPAEGRAETPSHARVRILGCPAHDDADALALEMLRQLLDPARWDMEVLSTEMLSAELVGAAGEKAPAVVCIGALPPGGLARTRYLCKRLRTRLPNVKIVVGRWGLKDGVEQNQEQLLEAGADQVETTLHETQTHLCTWLPVLGHEEAKATANGTATGVRAAR